MSNAEIARQLDRLADLSELDGDNPFKVRAYRNAATTIRDIETPVEELLAGGADLTAIKGIGKEIASKVRTLVQTGAMPQLIELEGRVPVGLLDVTRVKGVGPKQAATLWRALGVQSVDDLEAAARAGRLTELKGFGAKSAERILRGIESYRRNVGRLPLGHVDAVLVPLLERLLAVPGVQRLEVAGSYRRRKESVGDVDLVAVATAPSALHDALATYDEVATVLGGGDTKTSVELWSGLQVDLRTVEESSYGAALLYFTGSKEHNVELRQLALDKGWHLNEYGLYAGGAPGKDRHGGKRLAGATEEEVYANLGLPFVPPELREGRGEVAAAAAGELPDLIDLKDLRGDLHMHTTWSDGRDSLETMIGACAALGYEYMAVTDHSGSLALQGGLDDEKLRRQHAELATLTAGRDDIRVLRGMEVDILKDGSLDVTDEQLANLDIVIVSVHSFFELAASVQTERVVKALSHPRVNVYAHPLGRQIGQRDPIAIEMEEVFAACAANGVAVEHNASPRRLDLPDVQLRAAVAAGLKVFIGSDAHSARGLGVMRLGVDQARRAWLTAGDVVNTRPLSEILTFLGKA
ncbi:MAG TPA: DNA polymerase/3'-5' exonuclease PolX [Trueperaceae bacterium]